MFISYDFIFLSISNKPNKMLKIKIKLYGIRIHHGSIARSHDANKVGTVSMLVTQRLLSLMCPTPEGGPGPESHGLGYGSTGGDNLSVDNALAPGTQSGEEDTNPSPKYDAEHGVSDNSGDQPRGNNNYGPRIGNIANQMSFSNSQFRNNQNLNSNNLGLSSNADNFGNNQINRMNRNNNYNQNGNSNFNNFQNNQNGNQNGNNPQNNFQNNFQNQQQGSIQTNQISLNNGMNTLNTAIKRADTPLLSFGADRVAKINNINSRVSNNPDVLSGKVLSDAPQSRDNEYPPSRFALVERHRCKMGKCRPGYILGHSDDPSEVKRNGGMLRDNNNNNNNNNDNNINNNRMDMQQRANVDGTNNIDRDGDGSRRNSYSMNSQQRSGPEIRGNQIRENSPSSNAFINGPDSPTSSSGSSGTGSPGASVRNGNLRSSSGGGSFDDSSANSQQGFVR